MFNPFKPIGGAMGSIFGNQSKFNPMNAPGLKQVGNTLGMRPQQQPQPGGIGPSMAAFGGMMGNKFGGMQKPPMESPVPQQPMTAQAPEAMQPSPQFHDMGPNNIGGGIGPSMNGMPPWMQPGMGGAGPENADPRTGYYGGYRKNGVNMAGNQPGMGYLT